MYYRYYHYDSSSSSYVWSEWDDLSITIGNNNSNLLGFGNSILTGSVWIDGTYNHLSEYNNSPYGVLSRAINIPESNVDWTLLSSTGLLYDAGNGNFLEHITSTSLSNYDVVLTHLWTADMDSQYPLGSINSNGGDGSLAGAVKELVNYINEENSLCQLILVSVPPVSTTIYGDNVFTGMYGNNSSIAQLDTLMNELANELNFVYIDWQKLRFAKTYHDYTDGLNVHANNENTYRAMGGYLGGIASSQINF